MFLVIGIEAVSSEALIQWAASKIIVDVHQHFDLWKHVKLYFGK
jgi:hypothetical protein